MSPPVSSQRIYTAIAGLAGFLIALFSLEGSLLDDVQKTLICLLSLALPMLFIELFIEKSYAKKSTGLNWQNDHKVSYLRVATKLLGFALTLMLVASFYWLFPIYERNTYNDYWRAIELLIWPVILLSIPYFVFVDKAMKSPEDGYWQMGSLVLLNFSRLDAEVLKQHLLGWLVKAFFLALMFTFLVSNIEKWPSFNFSLEVRELSGTVHGAFHLLYTIDLAFITLGYLCTLRLLDTHIRSTDPTFFGWVITLICYQPLWGFIYSRYLRYGNGHYWETLFQSQPILYILWAVLLTLLLLIYVWSSMSFGLRFSNLTHRGIITSGPYRFVKHPAYLSKNLSWWLISLPFLQAESLTGAVQLSLMLLLVNAIYYWRAKTEERHLSRDETYREYAGYIKERGIWARLRPR